MPNTPRRWALREKTTTLHEAVDGAIGSFDTLSSYQHYLRSMSLFRLPLERSLRDVSWPAEFALWRPSAVSAELTQDLADFGMAMPDGEARSAPQGVDELMGISYVLQGSSLGAQVLLRRSEALGLSADYGARHLAAQADGTERWRSFLTLLEAVPHIDMDRVFEASSATFHLAKSAFEADPIPA